jgi:hypothetical protein
MKEKLQEAVSLYKNGDKPQALKLLAEIVKQESDNSVAWYGLALCFDEPNKKIYCLKRVLSLDPSHKKAQQLLEKLQGNDKIPNVQNAGNDRPLSNAKNGLFSSWLVLSIVGVVGAILICVVIGVIFTSNMTILNPTPTPIHATRTPYPSPTPSFFTRDPMDFIPTLPDGFFLDKSNEQINNTLADGTRFFSIQYTNKYATTVGDLSGVIFFFNIYPTESKAISGYQVALDAFENEQKSSSEEMDIDGADISTLYISFPNDKNLMQGSIVSKVDNIVLTTVSFTIYDPQAFTETFFNRFVADIKIIHWKGVDKLLSLQ